MDILLERNKVIHELRAKVKRSTSSSLLELSNMLNDSKDSRALVFLIDKINTDKEINKEILEDILDSMYEFNEEIIFLLEKKDLKFPKIFTFENIKILLLISVLIGVIFGVAGSDAVLLKILALLGVK